MEPLINKDALVALFGNSQVAVARAAGCTKQAVSRWGQKIPALRAVKIEQHPDGIRLGLKAWQMRPDEFPPPPGALETSAKRAA